MEYTHSKEGLKPMPDDPEQLCSLLPVEIIITEWIGYLSNVVLSPEVFYAVLGPAEVSRG